MQPRVAIIGAGIAGLSCAQTLVEHRCHVDVFDKSFHVGGRLATRFASRTDSSFYFDHGAQYFTVRSEAFKKQVDAWVTEGVAKLWAGRIGNLRNGKLLEEQGTHDRFVGTPYMRAVADHMARHLSIITNCRVISIRQIEKKWRLQFESGAESAAFDAIVISIPPIQAANLLQEFSDLETFCLANKMGACWATFARFDSEICLDLDGMFVENSALSWICRDSSKPQRPDGERWVLHATPAWTDANIDANADEVTSQLITEFFRVTDVKPVSSMYRKSHRWLYAIPIETGHPRSFQILPSAKLAICGDWCHGGRVEGAFLSGRETAEGLIRVFS